MRLHVTNYQAILQEKQITDEMVIKATGLSKVTYQWILENGFIEVETLERIADAIGSGTQQIAKEDPFGCVENVIEFTRDTKRATVTFSQGRYISKIKKLSTSHPEECKIIAENKDGSIVAYIPVSWVRINPGRNISEEQREAIAERIRSTLHNDN